MTTTPKQMTLPDEVQYALDRMCQPLDESVLWGATAREDKRCMQIIRDYIDAELAKQRKSSEAITLSEALRCLEDHALGGYNLQGDDVQRMLAVTDKLAGQQRNVEPVAYCCPDDPNNATAFAWPGTMREERHSAPLYYQPHQRNAAEVTDEDVSKACAAFLNCPNGDMHASMRAALSAVASRDYAADEDGLCFVEGLGWVVQCSHAARYIAKTIDCGDAASRDREDAERYRWLKNDPPLALAVRKKNPNPIHGDCEFTYIDGDILDQAIDAARQENKP